MRRFSRRPRYARYIRRIGEVGRHAFGSPADRGGLRRDLRAHGDQGRSSSTPLQVRRAEAALSLATGAGHDRQRIGQGRPALLVTAEYGLVGTPADYKLYGAGLLSSIGEGVLLPAPRGREKFPSRRIAWTWTTT